MFDFISVPFYEKQGDGNQDEIRLSPLQKACIDVCHFKEAGAVSVKYDVAI